MRLEKRWRFRGITRAVAGNRSWRGVAIEGRSPDNYRETRKKVGGSPTCWDSGFESQLPESLTLCLSCARWRYVLSSLYFAPKLQLLPCRFGFLRLRVSGDICSGISDSWS